MPPSTRDGGYGWIIVLAFFLTEVIVDGIRFSFGVLFVELLNEFKSGKGETAWIGSILIGVYNLCGPVLALIVVKVGCRAASFIGSGITCVGFVCSYFTTELYHLYITYGILLGFGYGLVFLAGTVSIGKYFMRRRAVALGLALCGSGVGQFGLTPLFNEIITVYTWRGAMFIFAGLSLNCCVFGSLYTPFVDDTAGDAELSVNKVGNDDVCDANSDQASPMLHNIEKDETMQLKDGENKKDIAILKRTKKRTEASTLPVRTFSQIRDEKLNSLITNSRSNIGSKRSLSLSVLSQSVLGSNASFEQIMAKKYLHESDKLSRTKALSKDITSIEDQSKLFKISFIENIFPKCLMTNINFLLMMVTSFLYGVSSFVPYSMLPDYAIHNGVSQGDSVWIISAMGIGGMISRVGLGVVTDLPGVHRLSLFGALLFLCGVSTMLIPFLKTFVLLLVYAFTFGFAFGGMYVVQPCLLLEYFGEEYIAEIFGILMFVLGVSALIGSPLAGWLYDITQNYNVSVIFAGGIFVLAGLTNFLVLCTKSSRASGENRKNSDNMNRGV